ncbi:hypothetical protein EY643_18895 [Halioglobus maricola]|uniref:Uncharacterized protein n=1 Tax=Halioglobus maricola TaxID=2601894 RepID=A0A5P9NNX6_9GAMM|nr:hypothetical protein [Halioglobus maricola]QFU77573.1 hypothetical protein EY643_18895 [Halioglobus maricola]
MNYLKYFCVAVACSVTSAWLAVGLVGGESDAPSIPADSILERVHSNAEAIRDLETRLSLPVANNNIVEPSVPAALDIDSLESRLVGLENVVQALSVDVVRVDSVEGNGIGVLAEHFSSSLDNSYHAGYEAEERFASASGGGITGIQSLSTRLLNQQS